MTEIWKDIPGYDGRYQVSNLGNVKSFAKKSPKILVADTNTNGYLRVCLMPGKKWVFVHRLVAEIFVPNPYNYPVVNHLDENRKNNKANNLEWCTQKGNLAYSRVGEKINADKCKALVASNILTGETLNFRSIREVERKGFNRRTVQKCLSGVFQHHKGYSWRIK